MGVGGREIITIQVGQCGNQIGREFWGQALKEHVAANPGGSFKAEMSTFFRNVDSRGHIDQDLSVGEGNTPIATLRARAVLVDMEDGVIKETLSSPLGSLFDSRHLVTDVFGAGNNWAHGFGMYGPQHSEALSEAVRGAAEKCDSLQSFFLMHSMGGGTGSGLGTFLLKELQDQYPRVFRFVSSVFPAKDDDVVTSPYNAVLALRQLTDYADCVIPADNTSLQAIAAAAASSSNEKEKKKGFEYMNTIVANVLIDLTSSMRFAGPLNVDLNEITTNLVPYPRLHYLLSSITSPLEPISGPYSHPTQHRPGIRQGSGKRRSLGLRRMFNGALESANQLMVANPRKHKFLACGLLARGDIVTSELSEGVSRLSRELEMIHWNLEGYKTGICSVPPLARGQSCSILCLSNNCCMGNSFSSIRDRFLKLYSRRAMVHHYTQYMESEVFEEALDSLNGIIEEYAQLNSGVQSPTPPLEFTNPDHWRRYQPAF